MIKKLLSLVLCGIMLFCLMACDREDTDKTYDTLFDTYPSVFVTENITSITFYAYHGEGKGSKVPKKDMTEIINWLDSFTIDKEATDEDVPPGTNFYFVEIEYSDGTAIKESLDLVEIDGICYILKQEPYPECFREIIAKTRF